MTETFVAILANRPNRQYDAADASEAPILAATVTISIARTAFEVIAATLPTGYTAEGRTDGRRVCRHARSPCHREVRGDAQAARVLQRRDPAARDGLNRDDRSLYLDDRDDCRIVCDLRGSDRDNGRFDCVARLATSKSFDELRSRPKPSLGRPRSSPETALLRMSGGK